jgi:hypothetical protein
LKSWQDKNGEVFLSLEIQRDGDNFCCIAVINPVGVQETKKAKYREANAPKYSDNSMFVLSPDEMKDIATWYDRAKAWHLKGKGNAVDWENKHLREEIAAPIRQKLADAKNEFDIMNAFDLRNARVQ